MSLFITNKEYRSREGISKSSLELFKKSPLHFKYAEEHPVPYGTGRFQLWAPRAHDV